MMYFIHYAIILVWYIPTLTLNDHCNISLSTITLMLQYTGMEVFDQSCQCRINCTISDIGYLRNTRYPISDNS